MYYIRYQPKMPYCNGCADQSAAWSSLRMTFNKYQRNSCPRLKQCHLQVLSLRQGHAGTHASSKMCRVLQLLAGSLGLCWHSKRQKHNAWGATPEYVLASLHTMLIWYYAPYFWRSDQYHLKTTSKKWEIKLFGTGCQKSSLAQVVYKYIAQDLI